MGSQSNNHNKIMLRQYQALVNLGKLIYQEAPVLREALLANGARHPDLNNANPIVRTSINDTVVRASDVNEALQYLNFLNALRSDGGDISLILRRDLPPRILDPLLQPWPEDFLANSPWPSSRPASAFAPSTTLYQTNAAPTHLGLFLTPSGFVENPSDLAAGNLPPTHAASTSTTSTSAPPLQNPTSSATDANLWASTTIDPAVLTQPYDASTATNPAKINAVSTATPATSIAATSIQTPIPATTADDALGSTTLSPSALLEPSVAPSPANPAPINSVSTAPELRSPALDTSFQYLPEVDPSLQIPNTDLQQPSTNTNLCATAGHTTSNALQSISATASPFAPSSLEVTASTPGSIASTRSAKAAAAPTTKAPKGADAKKTRSTGNKGPRREDWEEREALLVNEHMLLWHSQGFFKRDNQKRFQWESLSIMLKGKGYNRTPSGCYNYWCKKGREATGLDERSPNRVRNPGQLTTMSNRNRKRKSDKADTQTKRRKRARTSTTMTAVDGVVLNTNDTLLLTGYASGTVTTDNSSTTQPGNGNSLLLTGYDSGTVATDNSSSQPGNDNSFLLPGYGSGIIATDDSSTQPGNDNLFLLPGYSSGSSLPLPGYGSGSSLLPGYGSGNSLLPGYGIGNSLLPGYGSGTIATDSSSTQPGNDNSFLLPGCGSGTVATNNSSTQPGSDNSLLPEATDQILVDSSLYLPPLDPTSPDWVSFDLDDILNPDAFESDAGNVDA